MGPCTSFNQEVDSVNLPLKVGESFDASGQCSVNGSVGVLVLSLGLKRTCALSFSVLDACPMRMFPTSLLEEERPLGEEPGHPSQVPARSINSPADRPADWRGMSKASSDRQSWNTDLEQTRSSATELRCLLIMLHYHDEEMTSTDGLGRRSSQLSLYSSVPINHTSPKSVLKKIPAFNHL